MLIKAIRFQTAGYKAPLAILPETEHTSIFVLRVWGIWIGVGPGPHCLNAEEFGACAGGGKDIYGGEFEEWDASEGEVIVGAFGDFA